ncbi:MAG: glucose-6-phosphate isomerase [Deltaproteobacteria bacterium]
MKNFTFDFNNMMAHNIGSRHGIRPCDLRSLRGAVSRAHRHLVFLKKDRASRMNNSVAWLTLPYQRPGEYAAVERLGRRIARRYENVVSLGIGGSYLGLKAAQQALAEPYHNEFAASRGGRPRIYFEGNNLDPTPLAVLLKNLDPKKTFVVVISKSGETTETKAAFDVVSAWLKKRVGPRYGRQIFAITDPSSGALRRRVDAEQGKDPLSFRNAPLLPGVGGRYSEFNMGLLHLALIGAPIGEVLAGARAMAASCASATLMKNPAYLYGALQYLAYRKKGKPIGILMPFTELLTGTAEWYCQLLAESTGKKYGRRIRLQPGGAEVWEADRARIVHAGRTPVATRGTTDLHSLQQNNVEGENDKTVTMIRVRSFGRDVTVPSSGDFLAGHTLSSLLGLAQEATAWALARAERPNCTITIDRLTPFAWGALLFFFELATAFEGELLNVHAFDQPGVESYKKYMYHKLKKPGVSPDVAAEIEKHPIRADARFVL